MTSQARQMVKTVAIIGAGPSGLAAAKFLIAEKVFTKIDIFEQRSVTGGLWNYSTLDHDPSFSIPRSRPLNVPDALVPRQGSTEEAQFVGPVYDDLETNLPHTLMRYSDLEFPPGTSIFPHHSAVLKYVQEYGRDIESYISFQHQVISVEKPANDASWSLQIKNLATNDITNAKYDAVVVASGHYSEPFVPDVPGIREFDEAYPGAITHSKFYRNSEVFADKKVVVVGNLASGLDISNLIARHAKLPLIISEKDARFAPSTNSWSNHVPQITEFIVSQRAVRFSDGHVETDVDSIVYCTGYHYVFPFLKEMESPVFVPNGSFANNLWEHVLYTKDPTIAFLCIPQGLVPFPFAENQCAVIARMWSGRLDIPSTEEMDNWVEALREAKGSSKARHLLGFPADADYTTRFYKRCLESRIVPTLNLQNEGLGKMPLLWTEEQNWTRERIFEIKTASREFGSKRYELKTLAQLGFDYKKWKEDSSAEVETN